MRHFRSVCRFPFSICSTISFISTSSTAWTTHRQYSLVSAAHPGLMNKTSFIAGLAAHPNGVSSFTTCTTTAESDKLHSGGESPIHDKSHPLYSLWNQFDHSWVQQLSPETKENRLKSHKIAGAADDGQSNNVKRPVFNGHYVPVRPLPLKNPRLVIHSPDMATRLGLSSTDVHSQEFVQYLSGDVDRAFHVLADDNPSENPSSSDKIATWATPYALSIMGTRYTSNCPYGTGDGYGDGRAITIGEVLSTADLSPDGLPQRYELQLKGAGPTPFCRGADGRAVYRSSIREFLASEAMYNLNVATTRALSLILSDGVSGDKVNRPWYSEDSKRQGLPDIQDPRLSKYSLEDRKVILAQLKAQIKNDPNIMIQEPCAITCRVSPSFVRIGHMDLFARRATREIAQGDEDAKPDIDSTEFQELEQLFWHACFREFPSQCYHPFRKDNDVVSASKCLLEHSLENVATLVADWIRVGFVQGNFNADNCLIAGRTMDYGPFGWVDEYHPLYAKWTGSGDHFGFMNQPKAGFVNWAVLVASIMPLIEGYSENLVETRNYKEELMSKGQKVFEEKVSMVFRNKLGFHPQDESADALWESLEPLLLVTRVDWTVFWRRLMMVVREFPLHSERNNYEEMFNLLNGDEAIKQGSSPFYSPLDESDKQKYIQWIQSWRQELERSYAADGPSKTFSETDEIPLTPAERMRISNPKYILREHLLVEAYTKAYPMRSSIFASNKNESKDDSKIFELFDLIQNPYDEGREDQDREFFRRAPDSALIAGGTAFMSCSS